MATITSSPIPTAVMLSSTLHAVFLATIAATNPLPLISRAITAPAYYLGNCYSTTTSSQYAVIAYCAHLETLPYTPSKISILNPPETLDYEDGTWFATTPFVLTVVIGEDSYTAVAGTEVGSAVTAAGAGQKTYGCYRLTREQIYVPTDLGSGGTCTADYVCY